MCCAGASAETNPDSFPKGNDDFTICAWARFYQVRGLLLCNVVRSLLAVCLRASTFACSPARLRSFADAFSLAVPKFHAAAPGCSSHFYPSSHKQASNLNFHGEGIVGWGGPYDMGQPSTEVPALLSFIAFALPSRATPFRAAC